MTSQGSAYARFRRALDRGQLLKALDAATELRVVDLDDALALCVLLADADDARYEPAARRWLQRFAAERRPSLEEILIAGAALAALGARPGSAHARSALESLLAPD